MLSVAALGMTFNGLHVNSKIESLVAFLSINPFSIWPFKEIFPSFIILAVIQLTWVKKMQTAYQMKCKYPVSLLIESDLEIACKKIVKSDFENPIFRRRVKKMWALKRQESFLLNPIPQGLLEIRCYMGEEGTLCPDRLWALLTQLICHIPSQKNLAWYKNCGL